MVFACKNEIKEFNPTRLRANLRKPAIRTPHYALRRNNSTRIDPQLAQWFAESWRDNKDLYIALEK